MGKALWTAKSPAMSQPLCSPEIGTSEPTHPSESSTITAACPEKPSSPKCEEECIENNTVDLIVALGCEVTVSAKVVSDTLAQIEELGQSRGSPDRTAVVEIFYFIARVMENHTLQRLLPQASNPFKNPRHMASNVTRLIELYLSTNPQIRFLILTFPMHHLALMLSLRDHIGQDVFKVATIRPAPPITIRKSSLRPCIESVVTDFSEEKDFIAPTKESFNPFLEPDEPIEKYGKADFVLYTTSPLETVERRPIRIDLLIEEIRDCLQARPPIATPSMATSTPCMTPYMATPGKTPLLTQWNPRSRNLPHPLAEVSRARRPTKPLPLDTANAAKSQALKVMAQRQSERRRLDPKSPPPSAEETKAEWKATYREVYHSYRKVKLGSERRAHAMSTREAYKADDEAETAENENDDGEYENSFHGLGFDVMDVPVRKPLPRNHASVVSFNSCKAPRVLGIY